MQISFLLGKPPQTEREKGKGLNNRCQAKVPKPKIPSKRSQAKKPKPKIYENS